MCVQISLSVCLCASSVAPSHIHLSLPLPFSPQSSKAYLQRQMQDVQANFKELMGQVGGWVGGCVAAWLRSEVSSF